ncbi:BZ3500_MvSof-1268-A1-R1_Chr9g10314 [Microbotryum saponariae]|uniref:BZ3500_MvSof-1268-A1-R1_Chr9g10314 protein n=1 Tax=Microbotryum saponariae TaxID=289078 RepID=A0A2X0K914_9BASI|nr:BZ3501_MvSof-1269-A2-R1_Chr9g10064 [Microbotryum saponariae]SCZ99894.1 BZ3500_MvSof-1268-A1-R1_Chr9g10314 [Microbotryum saponariae]
MVSTASGAPPAKKPRTTMERSPQLDVSTLTSTLRTRLKAYAQLAAKLDTTLKDVNQVHSELDTDNKPINLVKGRLDRLYDLVGEDTNAELKRLDQAIETLDVLVVLAKEPPPPIRAPAVTALAGSSNAAATASSSLATATAPTSVSTPVSAANSPASSVPSKKRGPYKKKEKGDGASRAGSPTNSFTASPLPAYSTVTSPPLSRHPSIAGKTSGKTSGKTAGKTGGKFSAAMAASASTSSMNGSAAIPSPANASTSNTGTPTTTKKATAKSKKDSSAAPTTSSSLAFHAQLPLGPGRQVAFRQPSKSVVPGEEKQDEWILARVIASIGGDKHRYQVEDVDYDVMNPTPDEGKFNTTTKSIIPLPDRMNNKTYPNHDYTPGQAVLALYPETTSFYRAIVQSGPVPVPGSTGKKKDKEKVYRLKFEDDGDSVREIPIEFVLDIPDK